MSGTAPLRAGKGSEYEGGIREPTIVRWPGVTLPGSVCDTPVITMDFYPTILNAAGAKGNTEHNQEVDGVDISTILKGPNASLGRDTLFWYFPHGHRRGGATPYAAIRHKDHRLIKWLGSDQIELYDLKNDIGESPGRCLKRPGNLKQCSTPGSAKPGPPSQSQ
ncbi:MAG TPA: hypothetical protein EYQ63_17055 [Fuerstia sp.]|nr:hypothetical protein [Fuerstiella sp.]